MQKILVTGGTGNLGKEVVHQLFAHHYKVDVLSSKKDNSLHGGYNIVHGDLVTNKGLEEGVANADVIIHCASNPRDAEKVDLAGTQNLLQAIPRKENCHFIYISIVGIDKSDHDYYRIKLKTDQLIKDSGVPFSVLRAAQFHDLVLHIIRSFKNTDDTILVPRGMVFQSIDISEVAARLVELAGNKPAGLLPCFCGPQVLNIEAIMQAYIEVFKLHYSIEFTDNKNQVQELFSSGINLCAGNAFGKITWREFLQRQAA